jgi:hypothetical protein
MLRLVPFRMENRYIRPKTRIFSVESVFVGIPKNNTSCQRNSGKAPIFCVQNLMNAGVSSTIFAILDCHL